MNNKTTRNMKVYSGNTKDYKPVAQIRLQGKWLEDLGFVPGAPIEVKCDNGRMVIIAKICDEAEVSSKTGRTIK